MNNSKPKYNQQSSIIKYINLINPMNIDSLKTTGTGSKTQNFSPTKNNLTKSLKIAKLSKSPKSQKSPKKYGKPSNVIKSPKTSKSSKTLQSSPKILKNWLKMNKENCDTLDKNHGILVGIQPYDEESDQKLLHKIEYYRKRMKMYEETKRLVEEIEELDKNIAVFVPKECSSPQKNPHLDCYNMTKSEIKTAFYKHLAFLKSVNDNEVHSERHEMYQIENQLNLDGGISALCSNIAMVAFKQEQLMWLSKKLYRWFGDTVDYQMKVLLPELLLRIFMDKYNMSKTKAIDYLNNM